MSDKKFFALWLCCAVLAGISYIGMILLAIYYMLNA